MRLLKSKRLNVAKLLSCFISGFNKLLSLAFPNKLLVAYFVDQVNDIFVLTQLPKLQFIHLLYLITSMSPPSSNFCCCCYHLSSTSVVPVATSRSSVVVDRCLKTPSYPYQSLPPASIVAFSMSVAIVCLIHIRHHCSLLMPPPSFVASSFIGHHFVYIYIYVYIILIIFFNNYV